LPLAPLHLHLSTYTPSPSTMLLTASRLLFCLSLVACVSATPQPQSFSSNEGSEASLVPQTLGYNPFIGPSGVSYILKHVSSGMYASVCQNCVSGHLDSVAARRPSGNRVLPQDLWVPEFVNATAFNLRSVLNNGYMVAMTELLGSDEQSFLIYLSPRPRRHGMWVAEQETDGGVVFRFANDPNYYLGASKATQRFYSTGRLVDALIPVGPQGPASDMKFIVVPYSSADSGTFNPPQAACTPGDNNGCRWSCMTQCDSAYGTCQHPLSGQNVVSCQTASSANCHAYCCQQFGCTQRDQAGYEAALAHGIPAWDIPLYTF